MFEGSGYYDPHQIPTILDEPTRINSSSNNNIEFLEEDIRIPTFELPELPQSDDETYSNHHHMPSLGLENLQPNLGFNLDQDIIHGWDQNTTQNFVGFSQYDHHSSYPMSTPTPDLLSLLHLPSLQQTSVLPTDLPGSVSPYPIEIFGIDDQLPKVEENGGVLQMGYHPQPPPHQSHLLRDLFQLLPQNHGLYCGMDEKGAEGGRISVCQEHPLFDCSRDETNGEKSAVFTTDKQRRVQMNCKFEELKLLIPNLSKTDRAAIVTGAIDYIPELQRTVNELKLLIDKKKKRRKKKEMNHKIQKAEMAGETVVAPSAGEVETENKPDVLFNDTLRTSWLQRESSETFVDVRIVDDEVIVKMTQKKMINCLLAASKALDELWLDVVHVSAGFIGKRYVFLFNTKIPEGSSVYASAIAKKLLEAMKSPSYMTYPTSGFTLDTSLALYAVTFFLRSFIYFFNLSS